MDKHEYISTETNELFAALAKAQSDMSLANKSGYNAHWKNGYATLESFIHASRESLTKNGLCIIQQLHVHTEYNLILRTILGHSSGQWIQSIFPIAPDKPDIQSFGKYLTYIKRYAYASLIVIGTGEEDDDGEEDRKSHEVQQKTISSYQEQILQRELQHQPEEFTGTFLFSLGISKLSDLPQSKYQSSLETIKKINHKTFSAS
jgi:hypothetical protein